MPYCQKCGHYQDKAFTKCPNCSQTRAAPRKRSKIPNKIMTIATWVIGISFIAFIVAMMFLPQLEPIKDATFEYLNEGLRHYNEYPEYADLDIQREFIINSGDAELEYNMELIKPPELSRDYPYFKSQQFMVQEVYDFQVNIVGNGNYKIEGDIYNITGNIPRNSQTIILVEYKIRSYSFEIDMSPSESGNIPTWDSIPSEYRVLSNRRQWEVGDLDGDGKIDPVDEDVSYSPPDTGLQPGEDLDGDGDLDSNEDLDGDGRWDWRIDPVSDPIKQKALELKGDEENVYLIVKNFYDWVTKNHEYPDPYQMAYDAQMYDGKPKAALRVMEDGYGDCDDQSILFISLCRAVGIPAWLECGALYNPFGNLLGTQWEAHGWANLYIPLADGSYIIGTVDCVNSMFLLRDSLRFGEWEDDGVGNNLQDYYTSFSYYTRNSGGGGGPTFSDEFTSVNVVAHPSDLKIEV